MITRETVLSKVNPTLVLRAGEETGTARPAKGSPRAIRLTVLEILARTPSRGFARIPHVALKLPSLRDPQVDDCDGSHQQRVADIGHSADVPEWTDDHGVLMRRRFWSFE